MTFDALPDEYSHRPDERLGDDWQWSRQRYGKVENENINVSIWVRYDELYFTIRGVSRKRAVLDCNEELPYTKMILLTHSDDAIATLQTAYMDECTETFKSV